MSLLLVLVLINLWRDIVPPLILLFMPITQAGAAVAAAGIEAAAAGTTAVYNGIGASSRQKQAQRYYRDNLRDARNYNEHILGAQFGIQRSGMTRAGVNPAWDGSDMSNIATSPDPGLSAPEPDFQPLDFRSVASPIETAMLNQANINRLEAETNKLIKELPNVEALTALYKSQAHLNDEQAKGIAVNIEKTQAEINNLFLQGRLTESQTYFIRKQIDDVLPAQVKGFMQSIQESISRSRLFVEQAKSEYSKRQLNFAQTKQLEELAEKTMFDALTGRLTYQVALETFCSEVDKIISKNELDTRSNKNETAHTLDPDSAGGTDSLYYKCAQWYGEVTGTVLAPIGNILIGLFK